MINLNKDFCSVQLAFLLVSRSESVSVSLSGSVSVSMAFRLARTGLLWSGLRTADWGLRVVGAQLLLAARSTCKRIMDLYMPSVLYGGTYLHVRPLHCRWEWSIYIRVYLLHPAEGRRQNPLLCRCSNFHIFASAIPGARCLNCPFFLSKKEI